VVSFLFDEDENVSDTYTCAICGVVFESSRSNDEAMQESKALWGDYEPDDLAVICDDCFRGRPDGTCGKAETGEKA
jgi:hypothetical protein